MRKISISPRIFDKHPHFYRGVVIAKHATNHPQSPALANMLTAVTSAARELELLNHRNLIVWEDAYIRSQMNPNKNPPAVKSLVKRITSGKQIPFVNSAVAIFNIISIKYLLPCGGDDVDKIEGHFILGVADGSETFVPLGQPDKIEQPDKGEIVYFSDAGKQILCRRWNWRNCDITKLTTTTRTMVINVDCILPDAHADAQKARDELAVMLNQYCHAEVEVDFLNRGRDTIILDALA